MDCPGLIAAFENQTSKDAEKEFSVEKIMDKRFVDIQQVAS